MRIATIIAAASLIMGTSAANAAVIVSFPVNPPADPVVSQPNSGNNSGVADTDLAVARVFQWDTSLDLDSLTVQDHNSQALQNSLTLTIWSFADETAAANFTSPNNVAEFTGLNASSGSQEDLITFTLDTPLALTEDGWYAWGLRNPVGAGRVALKTTANNGDPAGAPGSWTYNVTTGTASATGNSRDFRFYLTAVPEPASLALLGLGGLAMLRRRRV